MVESKREGAFMDRMIGGGMFRKELSEISPNKWGDVSSTRILFDLAIFWDSPHGKNIGGARSWGNYKLGVKQPNRTTEERLNCLSQGERFGTRGHIA